MRARELGTQKMPTQIPGRIHQPRRPKNEGYQRAFRVVHVRTLQSRYTENKNKSQSAAVSCNGSQCAAEKNVPTSSSADTPPACSVYSELITPTRARQS